MSENKFANALDKIFELANKDAKKNGKWEDGDELAFVFNDGIAILSLEDSKFKVKIIAGEPEYVDMNLDLLEESEDEV